MLLLLGLNQRLPDWKLSNYLELDSHYVTTDVPYILVTWRAGTNMGLYLSSFSNAMFCVIGKLPERHI